MKHLLIILCIGWVSFAGQLGAQTETNYDESLVQPYELPELLVTSNGERITSLAGWEQHRPELLDFFAREMYGRTPTESIPVRYELLVENPDALGGKAIGKQIKFVFSNGEREHVAYLLLYLPKSAVAPVPVFVGYNYKGNHSTTMEPDIRYSPNFKLVREEGHPDRERGNQASRWAFEDIIDRGYAVATMCYHDIFPDVPGMKDHSIMALFSGYGTSPEAPDAWQAIGAWAWGSSRIVDFLATEPMINIDQVAIMGHSRHGKAALWAGAQDPRFKVVISNNSGEGGAALSRRKYGERLATVASIRPSWFCKTFDQYHGREEQRPIDQHQLIALMAPRAVYVASAVEDRWADPKGEYLAAYHASPVFALYGLEGLSSETMPGLHEPLMYSIGYHIRAGKHDVTQYDWLRYLDFADLHFQRR